MNNVRPSEALDRLRPTLRPKSFTPVHAVLYPALALGVGGSAQAGILYGGGPLTLGDNGSFDWDINGGGAEVTVYDGDVGVGALQMALSAPASGFGIAIAYGIEMLPVTPATTIGAGNTFDPDPCTPYDSAGLWSSFDGFLEWGFSAPGGTGIFGFQFDNGGTINYGVAEFTFASWDSLSPVGTFTINKWAYEDTGASISGAAMVPEPASTGVALMGLAFGATALRRRRRRRKAAARN